METRHALHGALILALIIFAPSRSAEAAKSVVLDEEQRQWLDAHRNSLTIAAEPSYRPYAFVDEAGQMDGLAGDYVRRLEERLDCTFKILRFETFEEILAAARERRVDIIPFIVAADERKSYLNFTRPFYSTADRILTRTDRSGDLSLDDLAGQRVGLVEGYALQAQLGLDRPEINVVPVSSEREGLRALSFGELDALIIDTGVASHYIDSEEITNVRVAGDLGFEDEQTFGSRSDWPILNDILEAGLASIDSDEREAIAHRWVHLKGVDPAEVDRLWRVFFAGLGLAALVATGVGIWNRLLQRQVALRTREQLFELGERKRAEARATRLAVAMEHAAEPILLIEPSGRLAYANPAFIRTSGLQEDRVAEEAFTSLLHESDGRILDEAWPAIADGTVWRGALGILRKDNSTMDVIATIAPIRSEGESIDGFVMTCRDVSLETELEARLRHREKLSALGTLASGMAHDFNNLLVPILSYADLLRDEASEMGQEYLDGIAQAGERARELARRILLFSLPNESPRETLDMREVIEETISLVRSSAPKTVKIRTVFESQIRTVACATQIHQLLVNLCTNAFQSIEKDGWLEVGLYDVDPKDLGVIEGLPLRTDGYFELRVSDNGTGMTSATTKRIFEPYYTEKPKGQGTGLGLATVHAVVASHDGEIRVESELGKGSTFRIFLPLEESPAVEVKRAGPAVESRGEHLLVVDDDSLVLKAQVRMLEEQGYVVTSSQDPIEALELFRASPDSFHGVVSDYSMPGLDGLELASRMHATRPDLPFVLLSGVLVDPPVDQNLVVLGKPARLAELSQALRSAFENVSAG